MNDQLHAALDLLSRYRDTFLANHQQEKANINAVLQMGGAPQVAQKPEEPVEAPKEKKRGKTKHG